MNDELIVLDVPRGHEKTLTVSCIDPDALVAEVELQRYQGFRGVEPIYLEEVEGNVCYHQLLVKA